MKQLLSLPLTSLVTIVGCTAYENISQNTSPDGMPFAVETRSENPDLNASMTDVEILAYFDLDIDSAGISQMQGKDGIQMTYVVGDRSVIIVRSQVSGISVVADGTNPAGAWPLGKDD